jgi:hypothetical protein
VSTEFHHSGWWASRESNTVPMDYETTALTKRELEAQIKCGILAEQSSLQIDSQNLAF